MDVLPEPPPELLPELPPEGGGVAVPGLLSFSAGGGVEGVEGATSGLVCAGGGAVPVPPCSVPAPPPPPRLQAVKLATIKPNNKRIFDACNFGVITDPFNRR
jgi:hypothetical protein